MNGARESDIYSVHGIPPDVRAAGVYAKYAAGDIDSRLPPT
jgi:hypothetical protein